MFKENCATHPLHLGKQLIIERDLSGQSILYTIVAQFWQGRARKSLKIQEKAQFVQMMNIKGVPQ